jgi:micrococcal nuclease
MRRFQQASLGVLLVVLGIASAGCDLETSVPPAPQAQPHVQPSSETAPRAATSTPAAKAHEAARSPTAERQAATADETLRVRKVIDGDTITVSGVGTVRLLGVDAPEKTGGYRDAERYGDEATRFMRELVDGKLVRLEYDGERKDQFNRTLAYVVLENGTIANEAIIRAGWAETYRRFTYRRKPQFQAAERDARAAGRGMWASEKQN